MGSSYDHPDEMRRDRDFDDRLVEDLLRGRTDRVGEQHRDLADLLASIRDRAQVSPRPDSELRHVFAEGVEAGATTPAARPARRRAGAARSRPLVRRGAARVAGLSLLAKVALSGAVATAAVGGAGAAGVLPGQTGDVGEQDDVEDVGTGQEEPAHGPTTEPGGSDATEPGRPGGGDLSGDGGRRGDGGRPGDGRPGASVDEDDAERDEEDPGPAERGGQPDGPAEGRPDSEEEGRDEAEDRTADTPASDRAGDGSGDREPSDEGEPSDSGSDGVGDQGAEDGDAAEDPPQEDPPREDPPQEDPPQDDLGDADDDGDATSQETDVTADAPLDASDGRG